MNDSSHRRPRGPITGKRHGFVDESARPGKAYLVCAVVIPPEDLSATRTKMRAVRAPRSSRVHMEKDGSYRNQILSTVATLDVEVRLFIAPTKGRSLREARNNALLRMLPDLYEVGVANLYLESCDQDKQDAAVLKEARAAVCRPDDLYFGHRKPAEEPLLWIPDVVAWSYGRDAATRRRVEHLITDVVHIRP